MGERVHRLIYQASEETDWIEEGQGAASHRRAPPAGPSHRPEPARRELLNDGSRLVAVCRAGLRTNYFKEKRMSRTIAEIIRSAKPVSAMNAEMDKTKSTSIRMVITPEIAKDFLARLAGNRRLRPKHIEQLAGCMQRGEWMLTNQGIGFDESGALRDGHHRLEACILSGVSFESWVVYGMAPNSYEVIDCGVTRNYADRMQEDRKIVDVIRLAAELTYGHWAPSVQQMKTIADSLFNVCLVKLVEHCGTAARFYSQAGMKLAACVVMAENPFNLEIHNFVLQQYRSLVHRDYESMSACSRSFCKHIETGYRAKISNSRINSRHTLAKGLKVFDYDKRHITKIRINDDAVKEACARCQKICLKLIGSK